MDMQFIGQNVHFAISLLASLASFAVFWLIFDAWTERKKWQEAIKWSGFLALALGLLVNGAVIDNGSIIPGHLASVTAIVSLWLRILGYVLIAAGQLIDPLMKRPEVAPEADIIEEIAEGDDANKQAHAVGVGAAAIAKLIALPLLSLTVAGLYWRRATTGLERHLRPVAGGFVALSIFEALNALGAWQSTSNPLVYRWVQNYGPIWWVAQLALLVGGVVLGRWVWQYLTKRLLSQIFMVLVTATVIIYFASTGAFSFLLLHSTRSQALDDLSTASHVLDYAIASKQAETTAQAEAVAAQNGVADAANNADHKAMTAAVGNFAAEHQLSSLVITDGDGKVLLRAEDPERWGDSLSSNSLIQRALIGREVSSVGVQKGVIAPAVQLITARPIRNTKGLVVGTVTVARGISSGFVDGIRADTGLDSTVYGGSQRAATTLTDPDGLHRAVGLKETNTAVLTRVLQQGKSYDGETDFQNRRYLAAYTPLKDVDNNTVGMLLVARPADSLLATAGRSVELAFLVAIALLALSIVPVYMIAQKISGGVR